MKAGSSAMVAGGLSPRFHRATLWGAQVTEPPSRAAATSCRRSFSICRFESVVPIDKHARWANPKSPPPTGGLAIVGDGDDVFVVLNGVAIANHLEFVITVIWND
jgi:hypothetical protein